MMLQHATRATAARAGKHTKGAPAPRRGAPAPLTPRLSLIARFQVAEGSSDAADVVEALHRRFTTIVQEWHEVAYEPGLPLAGIVSPDLVFEDKIEHVCCRGPKDVKAWVMQARNRFAACSLSEWQMEVDPGTRTACARWVCLAKGPGGLASADDDAGPVYGQTCFQFDDQDRIRAITMQLEGQQ